MITEIHADDFPMIYARLVKRFPKKPWLKRTQNLDHERTANPISIPGLEIENRIAYGLTWYDSGVHPEDSKRWGAVKVAMGFAIQVNALCEAEALTGSNSLAGRVAGAFNNPADLRAMVLELHAAIGLHRKGLTVEWPETTGSSSDTFDILAKGGPNDSFEVECKSFSPDKGLKITQKEAEGFFGVLLPKLSSTLACGEIVGVSITVPKKLPTSKPALEDLCNQVCAAILGNSPGIEGMFTLDKLPVKPFAHGELNDQEKLDELFHKHVQGLAKAVGSMTLVATTPQLACVLLTVESEEGDR
jgi:hypothetical protein